MSRFAHLLGLQRRAVAPAASTNAATATESPDGAAAGAVDQAVETTSTAEGASVADDAAGTADAANNQVAGLTTDPDAELRETGPVAEARARERERVAAIMAEPAAAANLGMAVHLACETDLPRAQAIGILRTSSATSPPPAARGGLDSRMASQSQPLLGDGGGALPAPDSVEGCVARVTAAARAAGIATAKAA